MNENVGLLNYTQEEGYGKPFSEATGALIDGEVKKLVDECYAETKVLLESKREMMERLAKRLLKQEVITLPDIIEEIGERPFPMKENIREYLQEMTSRKEEEEVKEAEDLLKKKEEEDAEEATDEEAEDSEPKEEVDTDNPEVPKDEKKE
jgi:AFG3 family protein